MTPTSATTASHWRSAGLALLVGWGLCVPTAHAAPSSSPAPTPEQALRHQLQAFFATPEGDTVTIRLPKDAPLGPPDEPGVQLEVRRLPARLTDCIPATLSAYPDGHDRLSPGLKRLQLACSDGQQHLLSLRLERFDWRMSAARALASGTPLTAQMLRPRLTALGKLRGEGFAQTGQLAGFSTRRRLRAGDVIRDSSVQAIPLVNFGDTLTYQVDGKGFSMQRSARALESGALDDRIRIELSPGHWVRARVIGQRLVAP